MGTGERIAAARKAAGVTQLQLAEKIGKTKSSIANYESGFREPDSETIYAIAQVLGVTPQSLEDWRMDSVQDVLEVLFRMEEQGFGIEPVRIGSAVAIAVDPDAPHAPKLEMALEKWAEQRKAVKDGTLPEYEYAIWRGSFDTEEDD